MKLYCYYFKLFIFVLFFVYIAFTILNLANGYQSYETCKSSNIWEYILVGLSFNFLLVTKLIIDKEDKKLDRKVCELIFIGILSLSLALWGGFELWYLSCEDLNKSNLWIIGLITFILEIVTTILFICGPIVILLKLINLETQRVNVEY